MSSHVECPKCRRNLWQATGRLQRNHRGLLRANVVCEGCKYSFWTARAEALQAARGVDGCDPEPPELLRSSERLPERLRVVEPPTFASVSSVAADWKAKQAKA